MPGVLVGISCATSNAREAYRIADRFRKAGSRVVMGGVHVSIFPQEALEHADSVVIGEAESVWGQVVRDYETGGLKREYRAQPLEDYFSPSYQFFMSMDPHVLYRTGVLLSRGCKYRCEFCVPPFGAPRLVKFEQAIALIDRINSSLKRPFGRKPRFIFRDDNIYSNPEYAKKLFSRLADFNLRWAGNSSIDISFDDEALALAEESGCTDLFVGLETIYPERLQKTSVHGMHSTEDYRKAIRKIKAHGIRVTGSFVLGFDYYTHRDYARLGWFLLRSGLYLVSLTILTPFPGSRSYELLSAEGRITSREWHKYDSLQHVVFKPKHTSARALQMWFIILRIIGLIASPAYLNVLLVYVVCYLLASFLASFLR